MTYHKFWKGLNREPDGDPRRRWDNNYVLKNEWIVCLIPLTNIIPILLVIGILETIIVLCPICNTINIPSWFVYISLGGVAVWLYIFTMKILPVYLKGAGMLIYKPKQPFRHGVEHEN